MANARIPLLWTGNKQKNGKVHMENFIFIYLWLRMKHETNFIIIIGWMQLVILAYHFTGCSRSLEIYRLMRINVSSYLFLNGYGHFQYFWRQLQQEKIQPETTGINKFIKGLQRFLMVFYVSNKFFQPKKSPIFQKCQHTVIAMTEWTRQQGCLKTDYLNPKLNLNIVFKKHFIPCKTRNYPFWIKLYKLLWLRVMHIWKMWITIW